MRLRIHHLLSAAYALGALAVMTVGLMAVPFLYACLLGLVAAVMTWQQGGPFTGALLVAGLAGAVAMGTFAGYFLHRARQLWKWTP